VSDHPEAAVLVADGSDDARRALFRALAGLPVVLLPAANSAEALAACLAYEGETLLALVDQRLPGLGGPETAAALGRLDPTVRACLLTAGPARRCRAPWGVAAVLAKPVRPAHLRRVVRLLLGP
jgi:CheY-like chemotaxis protein